MSHHIVEVQDIHFTYPDGKEVLRGITFTVTHGESVALVGANGAGKTTLLLHLNGFLRPGKGAVRIGHVPVTNETAAAVRRTVGMVFQDADDQLFMPLVRDDVSFGPLNMGLPPGEVADRVSAALERVGAGSLVDRPPYHLSGGEKRKVAIAGVLAMDPDILVMDEPSANLDPRTRRRLIELLRSFHHTKIIATNDLDLALDICERTIVLCNGTVRADGPTGEIFTDDVLLDTCNLERPLVMQGCPRCTGDDQ